MLLFSNIFMYVGMYICTSIKTIGFAIFEAQHNATKVEGSGLRKFSEMDYKYLQLTWWTFNLCKSLYTKIYL